MEKQSLDRMYMHRCLELALNGLGNVAPNPMVGAVIVFNNKIIAEGYHVELGKEHAERIAINSVKDRGLLKESTLYVSLEPCSHFGKTPPCATLSLSRVLRGLWWQRATLTPRCRGEELSLCRMLELRWLRVLWRRRLGNKIVGFSFFIKSVVHT